MSARTTPKSTPSTTPQTTPGGSLSRDDMKRLVKLGKERRQKEQELQAATAGKNDDMPAPADGSAAAGGSSLSAEEKKKIDETEDERDEREEAERVVREAVSKNHYIVLAVCTALFVSLPMSEPEVDNYQVLLFAAVNVLWIIFAHANTYMHMATFALLNMLLVQWSAQMYRVPELVALIPPEYLYSGLAANAVAVAGAWHVFVRPAPNKKKGDKWDLIFCTLIFVNIGAGVAIGVIPMRAIYLMFKSVTGLLANFQLPDDVAA